MERVVLPDGGQLVAGYYDYRWRQALPGSAVAADNGPAADLDLVVRPGDPGSTRAYFLRPADSSGFAYWSGQRAAGQTLAQVSNQFASSPEFVTRYGSVSNSAFVALVYANVLGRQPDAAGLQFWTQRLDSGAMTRGQVMIGFSESPEFVGVTATSTPHNRDDGSLARLYRAYLVAGPRTRGLLLLVPPHGRRSFSLTCGLEPFRQALPNSSQSMARSSRPTIRGAGVQQRARSPR